MAKTLVADAFTMQEPATTKPTFFIQKKIVINLVKTALFLIGVCMLIVNQARKDKIAQSAVRQDSGNASIIQKQSAMLPFNFLK